MSGRLLRQLYPRRHTQLGVDVCQMGLNRAMGYEEPCGDVLVAQSLTNKSHDV